MADSWVTRAALPTGRWAFAGAVVAGSMYAMGGINLASGGISLNKNEVYDPTLNTWATKAAMPQTRHFHAAFASGGLVYVAGGERTGVPAVLVTATEAYDPATNTWSTKASIPTGQSASGAAAVGILYMAGGTSTPGSFTATTLHQAYDASTNTWSSKAALPAPARGVTTSVVLLGLIYVASGYTGTINVPDVDAYDPVFDTWATKANIPTPRRGYGAGASEGSLYVFGGFTSAHVGTNESYNPATNSWSTRTSMPTARREMFTGERANGDLHAIGGIGAANVELTTHEAYSPPVAGVIVAATRGAAGALDVAPQTPAHAILSPRGFSAYPIVGDWRALQQAGAGDVGMTGRVDPHYVEALDRAFVADATWLVVARETGMPVFAGTLKRPSFNGGPVDLSADGASAVAARAFELLLYQSRDYREWLPADSEPHDYALHKRVEVDVRGGRITFRPERDHLFAGGEQGGAIFWRFAQRLQRVAFTIRKSDDAADWELVLFGTDTEDLGIGGALSEITTWGLGVGNPDGTEIDFDIPGDRDLVRLSLRAKVGTTPGRLRFWITDLRINGRAPDDDFTTSDIVRDVCSDLGVSARLVQESGVPALPQDFADATYAEVLDLMAIFTGWRWLIYFDGTEPVMDFAPYGARDRTWIVPDAQAGRDLLPLPRFSKVRVPIREVDGTTVDYVEATADPNPLGKIVEHPPVALNRPGSREPGRHFAQALADYLAQERYAGTVTFSRVLDSNGTPRHAHAVRAGDLMLFPTLGGGNVTLPVDQIEAFDWGATATFPDGIPLIERFNARQTRRIGLRGRA